MEELNWQPGASLAVLEKSALLRQCIHTYMQQQDVLEVLTPALSVAGTTDPNIHSFRVDQSFLHTSPEFAMKRLLAAYARDIYQIATVFRAAEQGRNHNAEFALLEWYRVGMNHLQLIDDVCALLETVFKQFDHAWSEPVTLRYTDAVAKICKKPFSHITVTDVAQVFSDNERSYPPAIGSDLDAALDLLVDEFIVADFADTQITVIKDYPASQAALAKLSRDEDGLIIAERFEIYWGQLELANGFHELTDATEQRQRFIQDQQVREHRGQMPIPLDEHLLQALAHGLPDCAGVALGLDRLLMALCGEKHIDKVLAFSSLRA